MYTALSKLHMPRSGKTDRVMNLISKVAYDVAFEKQMLKSIRIVAVSNNSTKYDDLLNTIESYLIKKAAFNLVIHNVPSYATEKYTGKIARTSYAHFRDTLEEFGKVEKLEIMNGTAYVRFQARDDALYTHNTINNMMIGDRIVQTVVV